MPVAASSALDDLASWCRFSSAVRRRGPYGLRKWVPDHDGYLRDEFSAGELPAHFSDGAAEVALREVKEVIGDRAFCLRNARRTALMLELVRLRLNRCDDEFAYSRDIRDCLEAGGPLGRQMTIRDRKGHPSLRP